ncbi:adenosine deaminase [Spirosoma knui]
MTKSTTLQAEPVQDLLYLRNMPKVELHVHLEGSIPPGTLLKLARKYNHPIGSWTESKLIDWFMFRDFPHFANSYMTICECIRTPEDIELLTYEFLQGQAQQNIVHTEFTFTAWIYYKNRQIPYPEQFAAIYQGRLRAERDFGTKSLVIVDIPRGFATAEEGLVMTEQVVQARNFGIVALGLGGYEVGNPVAVYKESFDLARSVNFPCILHAGETEGAASIWEALLTGNSIRIGHGVRCLEDPALVTYLREHRIPLEVCPTSNVCLNVVDQYNVHPLPELIRQGLMVTLNSDDPALFSTTLTDGYIKSHLELGLSIDTLTQLVHNAVTVSMMEPDEKQTLHRLIADIAVGS